MYVLIMIFSFETKSSFTLNTFLGSENLKNNLEYLFGLIACPHKVFASLSGSSSTILSSYLAVI